MSVYRSYSGLRTAESLASSERITVVLLILPLSYTLGLKYTNDVFEEAHPEGLSGRPGTSIQQFRLQGRRKDCVVQRIPRAALRYLQPSIVDSLEMAPFAPRIVVAGGDSQHLAHGGNRMHCLPRHWNILSHHSHHAPQVFNIECPTRLVIGISELNQLIAYGTLSAMVVHIRIRMGSKRN